MTASTSPPRSRTSTRPRTWATRWNSCRPTCWPGTGGCAGRPVRFLTGTDDNALKNVTAAARRRRRRSRSSSPPTPSASRAGRTARRLSSTTSSGPAAIRATRRASASCGSGARPAATSTGAATPAATARAAKQFYDRRPATGTVRSTRLEDGHRVELVLPALPLRRAAVLRGAGVRRRADRTGEQAQRGAGLPARRAGRHSASPGRPPGRAAGASRCPATRPGRLRVVGRAGQLRHRARLRHRPDVPRWWVGAAERVHVIGKGIVRFHAVYWLALLLSAGLAAADRASSCTTYLTVDGAKISKSAGNAVDPVELVAQYGTDALRWWLLREVGPSATPTSPWSGWSSGRPGPGPRPGQPGQPHGLAGAPLPRRRVPGAAPDRSVDALPARVDAALHRSTCAPPPTRSGPRCRRATGRWSGSDRGSRPATRTTPTASTRCSRRSCTAAAR